eukprot:gnl/TRDRNA2_/TRDRNA2_36728_c0_seq1.p1 gnl/TRDRNA2_/TRDRNA2_36728_c0~~gnl/TRDRNA2_/TRDRNA2_36728_c0_seq1.p1  ORF type:complete len:410 (-),score=101.69 gnl/TRDRNA2_/TRDRNA2_36728_c0_seq1:69-1256(-)
MPALGSGTARSVNKEALAAAVKRIDEQLSQAKTSVAAFQERNAKYDELRGILEDLPKRLSHPIMVPYGPLAFFEGSLEPTNEVLVQLSSEWFVLRTTKNALGTVDRRQERLRKESERLNWEVFELEQQKRVARGEEVAARPFGSSSKAAATTSATRSDRTAAAIHTEGAPPGASVSLDDDGYLDIREPLDDDDEEQLSAGHVGSGAVVGSHPTGPPSALGPSLATALPREASSSASAVEKKESLIDLARLRELERLEEQENDEEVEDYGLAELDELDVMMAGYEAMGEAEPRSGGGTPGAAEKVEAADAPKVLSPGDIYRLMGASGRAAEEKQAPAAAPEALPSTRAFTGEICERGRENVSGQVKQQAAGQAACAGSAEPPKRVSKFKADRAAGR